MAAAARPPRQHHQDTWDCMLPGPPSRSNGGCADCSSSGLLAFGAGSSVVVADPRSMQLVSVLPMPSPSLPNSSSSNPSLAPFVTSVRWSPHPIPRDLLAADDDPSSDPHLRLAVGDRQGRIAIWDFRSRFIIRWLEFDHNSYSKLGVQDLCWIQSDGWILASINGPSLLALWDVSAGRCFWKYDSSPELLSCIHRDPFDSRHFCALGLRGFLLSAKVVSSVGEGNVAIHELQIPAGPDLLAEIQKHEKESSAVSSTAPALSVFPLFFTRFCFSPRWRHIIYVTFPKELVAFDLQYGASLSSAPLTRGCGKFMDVVPDPDNDLLYCIHLDSKLSTWKRKEDEQVNILCTVEELIPSIGTPVPSPAVLSVVLFQSESAIQNISRLCSDMSYTTTLSSLNHETPLQGDLHSTAKTHLVSISDDGKIWKWLLTCESARVAKWTRPDLNDASGVGEDANPETQIRSANISAPDLASDLSTSSHAHKKNSNTVESEKTQKRVYYR